MKFPLQRDLLLKLCKQLCIDGGEWMVGCGIIKQNFEESRDCLL